MQDTQQGFVKQQQTQMIQFNYKPCIRAQTILTKKNTLKKQSQVISSLLFFNYRTKFINNSIHQQWMLSLYQNHKQSNIVYNATNKNQCNIEEQNVSFQSEFQSGNMEIISNKKCNQYQLYMKPDSNTTSHFQWFNFKIKIKKANKILRFIIKNFIKATMLYSKGLKPYYKSLKNQNNYKQLDNIIKFYQDKQNGYYCLDFSFFFQYDNDQVEFCSQPPYTFLQLNYFIKELSCKKLILGKTIMGTKIPYLIYQSKKQTKIVAFIIARQHPGEAVSSWIMEGFINKLYFHQYISWYIVPMVNIDGVILGNNRTGVLGHDFNRNWIIEDTLNHKNYRLFPQIQCIISLIKSLKKKYPRKLKMFIDFHGHSSQPNVFSYGPPHEQKSQHFYHSRLFPELISKKNNNFKLSQCSYMITQQKKNTARSVFFNTLGIPFTYTIQSTFGVMNDRKVVIDDFIKIGQDIAQSAKQFLQSLLQRQYSLDNQYQIMLQEIKNRYNTQNKQKIQQIQYDSASQQSDQNPSRKQIQQIIINTSILESQRMLKKQQSSFILYQKNKIFKNNHQQLKNSNKFIKLSKSLNKQSQTKLILRKNNFSQKCKNQPDISFNHNTNKQCVFPPIRTRLPNKMSFDESSYLSTDQVLQTLKLDYIQKRLQKLRHSKIGKKILVINAYSS